MNAAQKTKWYKYLSTPFSSLVILPPYTTCCDRIGLNNNLSVVLVIFIMFKIYQSADVIKQAFIPVPSYPATIFKIIKTNYNGNR